MFKSKHRLIVSIIVLALVVSAVWYYLSAISRSEMGVITIHRGELVQEVSVSGRVTATADVDLAFKQNGRVAQLPARVGDRVVTGQTLVILENSDERRNLREAELALQSARLELERLTAPVSEAIEEGKLTKAYENGLSEASSVYVDLYPIIDDLDDIFFEKDLSTNRSRENIDYYVEVASFYDPSYKSLPQRLRADYQKLKDSYSPAFSIYQNALRGDSTEIKRQTVLSTFNLVRDTLNVIKLGRDVVNFFRDKSVSDNWNSANQSLIEEHLSSLSAYYSNLNDHWLALVEVTNIIQAQQSAIIVSDLDLRTQRLVIDQKESDWRRAEDRLSDTYLRAAFTGVISRVDVTVGESVLANVPVISLISVDNLEIESYVPEINISFLKIGDVARVTLDAYGDEVEFPATVLSIDPAETIRDGVSTYKMKLRFNEQDSRVKSGMTANVTVITERKPDVLLGPSGVIYQKDNRLWVRVKSGDQVEEREVHIGAKSSFGQVEIISGLQAGDEVLLAPEIAGG